MTLLDEIEARLAAATPGPWAHHDFGYPGDEEPTSIVIHTGRFDWSAITDPDSVCGELWPEGNNVVDESEICTPIAHLPDADSQQSANAELIARAPEDLAVLLGVVREVAGLHRAEPGVSNGVACNICRECLKAWPCPTARALEALTETTEGEEK